MKKMKNFIMGVIVGAALTATSSVLANSEAATAVTAFISDMKVVINGQNVELTDKPLIQDGKSYLPVRSVAEILGYNVDYNAETHTAILSNNGDTTPVLNNEQAVTSQEGSGSLKKNLIENFLVDGKLDVSKVKEGIESGTFGINDQDASTGETLLIRAVKENHYGLINYIHDKGADVNLADFEGKTPVHHAVISKSDSALGNLTKFKAKTKVKDKNGKIPMDYTEYSSGVYLYLRAFDE